LSETYKPMVNHLTRIILKLVEDPVPYDIVAAAEPLTPDSVRQFGRQLEGRAERVAAMMEALAERGFTFKFEKDRIFADSSAMEAQEAKKYLIARGFQDREFQVMLEYARKWGVM
jgi:superfamily II DNA/RNA helicase